MTEDVVLSMVAKSDEFQQLKVSVIFANMSLVSPRYSAEEVAVSRSFYNQGACTK